MRVSRRWFCIALGAQTVSASAECRSVSDEPALAAMRRIAARARHSIPYDRLAAIERKARRAMPLEDTRIDAARLRRLVHSDFRHGRTLALDGVIFSELEIGLFLRA